MCAFLREGSVKHLYASKDVVKISERMVYRLFGGSVINVSVALKGPINYYQGVSGPYGVCDVRLPVRTVADARANVDGRADCDSTDDADEHANSCAGAAVDTDAVANPTSEVGGHHVHRSRCASRVAVVGIQSARGS